VRNIPDVFTYIHFPPTYRKLGLNVVLAGFEPACVLHFVLA